MRKPSLKRVNHQQLSRPKFLGVDLKISAYIMNWIVDSAPSQEHREARMHSELRAWVHPVKWYWRSPVWGLQTGSKAIWCTQMGLESGALATASCVLHPVLRAFDAASGGPRSTIAWISVQYKNRAGEAVQQWCSGSRCVQFIGYYCRAATTAIVSPTVFTIDCAVNWIEWFSERKILCSRLCYSWYSLIAVAPPFSVCFKLSRRYYQTISSRLGR